MELTQKAFDNYFRERQQVPTCLSCIADDRELDKGTTQWRMFHFEGKKLTYDYTTNHLTICCAFCRTDEVAVVFFSGVLETLEELDTVVRCVGRGLKNKDDNNG